MSYSATNAHTQNGPAKLSKEAGLLPRVFSEIVERLHTDAHNDTKITISFLEIFNERIHDLFHRGAHKHQGPTPNGPYHARPVKSHHTNVTTVLQGPTHSEGHRKKRVNLKVREHPLLGPYVDGMLKVRVRTPQDVMSALTEALHRRDRVHEVDGTAKNHGT